MRRILCTFVALVVLIGLADQAKPKIIKAEPPPPPGGDPRIIDAPPFALNDMVTNNNQQGFNERQGVFLDSPLRVDSEPGGLPGSAITIGPGLRIDSHMIFMNLDSGNFRETVTWTFDGIILGVMSDRGGELEADSTPLLGASGTGYPSSGFNNRGFENLDSYTISGNTLIVNIGVGQPGDWIRVVTLSPSCTMFGVDGDTGMFIKLDVDVANPTVEILGPVINGSRTILHLEAMTWDPFTQRILMISEESKGPLYEIDPNDIPTAPPANVPTTLVGNTGFDDIEGIAIHPVTGELFGVENTTHKFLKIDKSNGQVELIGDLRFEDVEGLAFTLESNPRLFATDTETGRLITINTSTGAATEVSVTNSIGFPNIECLEFCPDGRLFGFSNGSKKTVHRFVTIDTTTGIGTEFSTIGAGDMDIEGLALLLGGPLFTNPTTEVEKNTFSVPEAFILSQNYPNPFNPETTIRYEIPNTAHVTLKIYNLLGQELRILANEMREAGSHAMRWDGTDRFGQPVASGIYLYQIQTGDLVTSKKMTLLK